MLTALLRPALLISAALLLWTSLAAQQPQAPALPTPPERVIINFIVPVTPDTVNMLISITNAQVRNGTKKITIVLSSSGGDPSSAFAAYNILRSIPAEITTFNAGNVDSATLLIYCAGKHRYSMPSPARFLIHGTMLNPITTNMPVESRFLESQLMQMKSLDQVIAQVIKANSTASMAQIEDAIHGQKILSPDEAKQWGIVQEIKETFMEPGAVFVGVNTPPEQGPKPLSSPYTTERPAVSSSEVKKVNP